LLNAFHKYLLVLSNVIANNILLLVIMVNVVAYLNYICAINPLIFGKVNILPTRLKNLYYSVFGSRILISQIRVILICDSRIHVKKYLEAHIYFN